MLGAPCLAQRAGTSSSKVATTGRPHLPHLTRFEKIAAASLSSAVHAKDDLRGVAKALGLAFSPKKGEQDAQQVLRLLSALPFNAGGGVSWGPRWVVGGSGCGGGGGGEDAHLKLLRNTEVGHSNKKASSMILASALIPQPNLTTALVAKLRGLP